MTPAGVTCAHEGAERDPLKLERRGLFVPTVADANGPTRAELEEM